MLDVLVWRSIVFSIQSWFNDQFFVEREAREHLCLWGVARRHFLLRHTVLEDDLGVMGVVEGQLRKQFLRKQ